MLDFIGIGARRAGEDWLFSTLRRHPEIHFPRDLELGFWSQHYPLSLADADYARNLDWYRSVFGHWPEGVSPAVKQQERPIDAPEHIHRRNWFDKLMAALDALDRSGGARLADLEQPKDEAEEKVVQAGSKLGDFSPSYNYFDDASTLEAIHAFAPDARIIYIVRDPHQRAWEAAEKLRGLAGLSEDEVSDAWYMDHFRSRQSQRQGDYARAIEQWQAHYGDALLVLHYEDVQKNAQEVLRAACKHIGVVDTHYFDAEPQEALTRALTPDTPVRASLYPALRALYAEKCAALKAIIGTDYTDK